MYHYHFNLSTWDGESQQQQLRRIWTSAHWVRKMCRMLSLYQNHQEQTRTNQAMQKSGVITSVFKNESIRLWFQIQYGVSRTSKNCLIFNNMGQLEGFVCKIHALLKKNKDSFSKPFWQKKRSHPFSTNKNKHWFNKKLLHCWTCTPCVIFCFDICRRICITQTLWWLLQKMKHPLSTKSKYFQNTWWVEFGGFSNMNRSHSTNFQMLLSVKFNSTNEMDLEYFQIQKQRTHFQYWWWLMMMS